MYMSLEILFDEILHACSYVWSNVMDKVHAKLSLPEVKPAAMHENPARTRESANDALRPHNVIPAQAKLYPETQTRTKNSWDDSSYHFLWMYSINIQNLMPCTPYRIVCDAVHLLFSRHAATISISLPCHNVIYKAFQNV